jgi:hypothetical protein
MGCSEKHLRNSSEKNYVRKNWGKEIRNKIEERIRLKMDECIVDISPEKCQEISTVYVELNVWADVLESAWEIVDTRFFDGNIYIIIKRGKDIPLVGELNIGKFDNIKDIKVKDGFLEIIFKKDLTLIKKAQWCGIGSGIGALIAVLLFLL